MNSEADARLRELAKDVEARGGRAAHRLHALKSLRLKTVLKESHCTPIEALAFNHSQPGMSNLFATVGKNQATVYDNKHMNEHIAVVVHFTNAATQHHTGGDLSACAWVNVQGLSAHPHGDAVLVVAGADTIISIISVVEARVVALLRGHQAEVVDLCGCAAVPGLLLSMSKTGEVRLWDVPSQACLASIDTDAFSVALHQDGSCFVTGHRNGKLARWDLAALSVEPVQRSRQEEEDGLPPSRLVLGRPPERAPLQLVGPTAPAGGGAADAPESLLMLPHGRLAARSSNGWVQIWDLRQDQQEAAQAAHLAARFRIPGVKASVTPSHKARCGLAASADGAFIAAGNSVGEVHVFDGASGERVAKLEAMRVHGPVRAVGIGQDGLHVLGALGNGFVFRWEYLLPLPGGDEQAQGEQDKAEALVAAAAAAAAAGEVAMMAAEDHAPSAVVGAPAAATAPTGQPHGRCGDERDQQPGCGAEQCEDDDGAASSPAAKRSRT